MRYFLGIELPDQVRYELVCVQQQLKKLSLFSGTYVAPENLHVTLMFFGSLEEGALEYLRNTLTKLTHAPFRLQLNALDIPNPRLLWVTTPSDALTELYNKLATLLPQYTEKRPYVGHITLARIKKIIDKESFSSEISNLTVKPLSWDVKEVTLFQSETLPDGPVYTPLNLIDLT